MKRSREHVLEEESRLAFRARLPKEWIVRDKRPDYGIDAEVEIVEEERITNKILWFQIKATEKTKRPEGEVSLRMKTKHLKYYQSCRLPVVLLYWIKSQNDFYYLFVQRFIHEELSAASPEWRKQNTVTVKFSPESKLETAESLRSVAIDGYLYIAQRELSASRDERSPIYWLNGIPMSDDAELKERTVKALCHVDRYEYSAASEEYENILRICATTPTQRMSILLGLGNSWFSLCKYDEAMKNYNSVVVLGAKGGSTERSEGESYALANIGLIHCFRGDFESAMTHLQKSLKIMRQIGNRKGEAIQLGNIGRVLLDKNDLDGAMRHMQEALRIDHEICYKEGVAHQLGNIGLAHLNRGELGNALNCFQDALKIDRETGDKDGEAASLGNIGLIYMELSELENALQYFEESLRINREIGDKEGMATVLGNIGGVWTRKGDFVLALKYLKEGLGLQREIGHKRGETVLLGQLGRLHSDKGDWDIAQGYLEKAHNLFLSLGDKSGTAKSLALLGFNHLIGGRTELSIVYLRDALKIWDTVIVARDEELVRQVREIVELINGAGSSGY